MKILIISQKLDELGGSQTFTLTIAKALIKKGYEVEYYTTKTGLVAKELVKLGATKKGKNNKYDLIIVNQNNNAKILEKLKGRKVQIIHGIVPDEAPIQGIEHIAVSQEVAKKYKINKIIAQPVDLDIFKPKSNPDIQKRRVLSLCQGEEAQAMIADICDKNGWKLETRAKFKNAVIDIEKSINKADIVVSLGRGVVESLACGRPVVVFDIRGYNGNKGDGLIARTEDIEQSQSCNFSGRAKAEVYTVERLEEEMRKAFNYCWLSDGYRKHAEDFYNSDMIVDKIIG